MTANRDNIKTLPSRQIAYQVLNFPLKLKLIKMPSLKNFFAIILSVLVSTVMSGSKNKPHGHTGVLDHYDGKLLPFKITAEQSKKLDSGEPVRLDESFFACNL